MEKKDNILTVENLSFSFQEGKPFFDNISFEVEPGKLNFIQGRNGSGKSTLLRILQGLTETEYVNGTITFDGKRYIIANNKIDSSFTSEVKMVAQNINTMIADQFTIEQNLKFANLPAFPGLQTLPKFSFS